ncbi:glycosyltransferase [Candidatus Peregrinibacteria bacterium]|jgi:polysaccharide pyruvyl transferase CsaB|nr:glycosyltransferase [Candidatus Peregrinibacteria bacterium]MBT7736943.1 glycosyltransferase [Candidatus Peregrinibacteria bacterium]
MKFSVVIPTYNNSEGLKKCLTHLNRQKGDRFEVVVVDDGSTDDTTDVLLKWKENKDLKFDLKFVSQDNKKQGAARNRGVQEATGSIISFIGSDILVQDGWMEAHQKFHRDFPENDSIALGFMTWSPEIADNRFRRWLEDSGVMISYKGLTNYNKTDYWHFYTGNISMKKKFFEKYKFDEAFDCYGWEDIMLGYRMLEDGASLYYVEAAKAWHDHELNEDDLFPNRMRETGRSALVFQNRFPKVKVVPRGFKKLAFNILSIWPVRSLLGLMKKEWGWYTKSKKYFLEGVKMGGGPVEKILIIGSYGAGNIGDEAMLDVILDKLEGKECYVLSGDVKDTKKRHPEAKDVAIHFPFGLRSFFSFKWLKSFKLLRKSDLVLLGGGGLFTDMYSFKAILLWCWHIRWARFYNKRVILFANSVGPFKSKLAAHITKKALKKCEKVIVRDELSAEVVKKLIGKDPVVGSDVVFLKDHKCKVERKKSALINLRPWDQDFVEIKSFVGDLIDDGYEVTFVAMEKMDEELLMKLHQQNVEVVYPDNFKDLLNLLSGSEMAIGMRLHFLIAAAMAGCKVGGISYGLKVSGILDELNIPMISVEDFSVENLKKLQRRLKEAENLLAVRSKAEKMFKHLNL